MLRGDLLVVEKFPARKYVMDGLRVVASGPVFYMTLTFLGIGGLAEQAGVSLGFALVGTVLIWAGPAQVIFLADDGDLSHPLLIDFIPYHSFEARCAIVIPRLIFGMAHYRTI